MRWKTCAQVLKSLKIRFNSFLNSISELLEQISAGANLLRAKNESRVE